MTMSDLTVRFKNDDLREMFCDWLSNSGEQDLFQAAEEHGKDISSIHYHSENEKFPSNDKRRYGKYLGMTDENGNTMIVIK